MQQLFAAYIGGMIEGCHVELHDVRFVIGEKIEDCYDDLKAQWWGAPETLHLDAWGPILWTDGFRVEIVDEPQSSDNRLYLANLGGYDPKLFTELHENLFIVARDPREAKKRALAKIDAWVSPHRDAVLELETVIDIAASTSRSSHYVKLIPDDMDQAFSFEARYVPIGKMT